MLNTSRLRSNLNKYYTNTITVIDDFDDFVKLCLFWCLLNKQTKSPHGDFVEVNLITK